MEARFFRRHVAELVGAAQDALLRALRHGGMGVILVQRRDVIEDVLVIDEHALAGPHGR